METRAETAVKPKFFLAPMEGVTDFPFRQIITRFQPIDYCVSEFLRVTTTLHPYKVFLRHMPELTTNSRTLSGTPVLLQLLGGQVEPLSENAARADELGAYGVDLNFGCPAKLVNRHDGGACLLKSPDRIFNIVKAVRASVQPSKPVTAKIRLGFSNPDLLFENAKAAEEAGAAWLTVHCRTKEQGYKPPAFWEWIPLLKEKIKIPIIANGDIFTVEDFKTCQKITACDSYMIGRGALRRPFLFDDLHQGKNSAPYDWPRVADFLLQFHEQCTSSLNSSFAAARIKQSLRYIMIDYPQAKPLFEAVKAHRGDEFTNVFHTYLAREFLGAPTSDFSQLQIDKIPSLEL